VRSMARDWPTEVLLETASEQVAYAQLDREVDILAQRILEELGPHDASVAMQLWGTHAMLVSGLAVLRAGKATVPIDPNAPAEWVNGVINDSRGALLLSDALEAPPGCPVATLRPLQVTAPTRSAHPEPSPSRTVSIVYTSGSTGEPKGVVIRRSAMKPPPQNHPGTFDHTTRIGFIATGTVGTSESRLGGLLPLRAPIVDYDIHTLGIAPIRQWLREQRIFGFMTVPTVFRHVFATLAEGDHFPDLQMVGLYGETATWEDLELLWPRVPPSASALVFFGLTETGFFASMTVTPQTPRESGPLPIGTIFPGRTVTLVDDAGHPVAPGEVGEIVVAGEGLASSYVERPALTAQVFGGANAPMPFVRTGDRGRWRPDGLLAHEGRRDQQVQIAGHRVELGEIEVALAGLPGVATAVAAAHVDAAGDTRITAFVVAEQGSEPDNDALRAAVAARLPASMVPDHVEVVDQIPRLSGGKADRRTVGAWTARTAALPNDPLELALAAIWTEVLDVPSVRSSDHFFDLGGDSIRAARMFAEVEQRLGLARPIALLLEAPTLGELAAMLRAPDHAAGQVVQLRQGNGQPPLVILPNVAGSVMFARNLAERLGPGRPVFGISGEWGASWETGVGSIQELAAQYLPLVRGSSPDGPYLLFGYSAGGSLAFELGCQLERAGAAVALVALGDSMGPGLMLESLAPTGALARRSDGVRGARQTLAAAQRRARATIATYRRRARLRRSLEEREQRAIDSLLAAGRPIPPELRWRLTARHFGALATLYRPDAPLAASTLLLRSNAPGRPADLGWGDWVTGSLEVVDMEGGHYALLQGANAAAAARALDTSIGDALARLPLRGEQLGERRAHASG
jgi:acyl-CoA synthetase (AMP-forming)/AMP-acid ligase II/thioesterase domain-containing protein/acyl carrier protein